MKTIEVHVFSDYDEKGSQILADSNIVIDDTTKDFVNRHAGASVGGLLRLYGNSCSVDSISKINLNDGFSKCAGVFAIASDILGCAYVIENLTRAATKRVYYASIFTLQFEPLILTTSDFYELAQVGAVEKLYPIDVFKYMLEKSNECHTDNCLSFMGNYPIKQHELNLQEYRIDRSIPVIDYNIGLVSGVTAARLEL